MSIKRTIIAAIVGLTLVALVAPGVAQGVTIEELLAQIAQLQAQLVALQQAQGGTTTGTVPSACVGVTLTRNLTVGSSGSDVKCFQALLNQSADTRLAASGVGSPGNETMYFGPLTKSAAVKYQEKYAASILTPVGLTYGTGFVGPSTRSFVNSMLASGTTGGDGTTTPPVVVPTGAGLTVQLAYDNPAAGTIVNGQALAPLAKLTFVNGDNAEVTVTGLKLKRIGISADASLTNVYLFDGAIRLTDGAAVSSTNVNFNLSTGIFKVPAGGSKTITVATDVSGTSGETVGMQLVSAADVTSNSSSIKGSFPLTGNLMTLATGTLASVVFNTTTSPSGSPTIDPQDDYTVFQNVVVVHTRAVDLKRISFRKTGSVANTDIQNFRLYVDGVQVGSTVQNLNSDGYVTFDLTSSPKRLEAGSRTIKVLGDIIGGSNLNFTMNLWNAADITVVDSQYGANILVEAVADGTAFTKRSTGTITVSSGVLSITKMTDSPSGNIVNNASNATLAKFQVKASGERVKIESLKVSVRANTSGVSGLRNGMLLANGVQIGSTTTLYDPDDSSYNYTTFNLGSSLIVEPGSPVTLEVRADIYDTGTSDTDNSITTTGTATTLQVVIEGSSDENNALGMTSAATIDAPASDVSANTLTVSAGGLTLSKYTAYTDQSMVPPLTAAKLAHFTVTANTTEGVNITTIEINLDSVVSSYGSNLYATFGNDTLSTKASISGASNEWSVNYNLATGETKDLIVYADINSSASGTGDVSAYVAGTTASSAASVTAGTADAYTEGTSGVQGQAVAFTTGTFTPAVDGATPLAAIVAGGQEVVAGKFKFTTLYESYTIKELRFTLGAAARSAAIISAVIKDGDTVLATVPYDNANSYFNVTGLSVAIPSNTTKVLTIAYNLSPGISSSTSTSQIDLQPTLDYVKYADSQGTQTCIGTSCTTTTTYATSKEMYVFKSVPTVTKVPVTTSTITAQTVDLYSWKVAADAKGAVTVKQVKFDLTWRDGDTSSSLYLYAFKLFKDGNDITSLVTITDEDGNDLEGSVASAGANENSSKVIILWATEDVISAGSSSTYVLRATTSGFTARANIVNDDGVTLNLAGDTAVNGSTVKYLTNIATGDYVQMCTSAEASNTDYNFIWSDNSALDHDSTESEDNNGTASTSGDWANGYLVKDLPLSTTTWLGP